MMFLSHMQQLDSPKQRNTGMTPKEHPSEEEQNLMLKYGITSEQKSVYLYQGHKYDRLSDAIKYARDGLDHESTTASAPSG